MYLFIKGVENLDLFWLLVVRDNMSKGRWAYLCNGHKCPKFNSR